MSHIKVRQDSELEEDLRSFEIKNFHTNQVLKYRQGSMNQIYFVPAYMRAKVLSLSKVSYEEMTASLNCQIFIDICYAGLSNDDKEAIIEKGIKLTFDTDGSINLNKENPEVTIEDIEEIKMIRYNIRNFINIRIEIERWKFLGRKWNGLILSPFEVVKGRLAVKMNRVIIKWDPEKSHEKWERRQINFNLMDFKYMNYKISGSMDSQFGLFTIATKLFRCGYVTKFTEAITSQKDGEEQQQTQQDLTQQRQIQSSLRSSNEINRESEEQNPLKIKQLGSQRLDAFNVAIFEIPMFKSPLVGMLTIFLPMLMLAILNIGIFYQQADIKDRLVSVGALLVAFIALIPSIRQQIPATEVITLVESLVFLQAFTTILALIDSLMINRTIINMVNQIGYESDDELGLILKNNSTLKELIDSTNTPDTGLYIGAIAVSGFNYLVVIFLLLAYLCFWKKGYTDESHYDEELVKEEEINFTIWRNQKCDKYFKEFFITEAIEIVDKNDESQIRSKIKR